jgi:hypothetical protein
VQIAGCAIDRPLRCSGYFPQSGFWSNDSNEDFDSSFVATWVQDLRGAFDEDGTLDFRRVTMMTLRLPVTASEIASDIASGSVPPLDGTLDIDSFLWPTIPNASGHLQGTTSPSGSLSTAIFNSGSLLKTSMPPRDRRSSAGDGNVMRPQTIERPQWSPDGQTIAFGGRRRRLDDSSERRPSN